MLTDLDRRIIANLAIPRNVPDLYGMVLRDAHTPVGPDTSERQLAKGEGLKAETDLDAHLREHLEPSGLVVKVGAVDDHVKLAAKPPKDAYEWGDDSPDIYARRMAHPARRWRTAGDLWLLSAAGLDAIKEPTVPSPDLGVDALQAAINAEWARVAVGPGGGGLTDEEFHLWLDQVLGYYDVEAKSLQLPVAGGASGWSDAFELTILDQENQKTLAPALIDPWFLALSILAFNDTDTGTTADNGSHIPTYTGYARKSVAASLMSAAAAGSSNNSGGAITFAACTSGTSTILAVGNCSASTVGILRKWGDVSSTVISTTQTPATLNTGAYVTTAD